MTQFQQTASTESSASNEIPRLQWTAIRSMMRDHLADRPVHLREIVAGEAGSVQPDLQGDVVGVSRSLQVWKNLLVLRGGRAEWLERFPRDNPWRDRCRKILGEEGAQRLVFPRLNVARGPVIEEADSDEVIFRLGRGNG